jgi:hypothetical protein
MIREYTHDEHCDIVVALEKVQSLYEPGYIIPCTGNRKEGKSWARVSEFSTDIWRQEAFTKQNIICLL